MPGRGGPWWGVDLGARGSGLGMDAPIIGRGSPDPAEAATEGLPGVCETYVWRTWLGPETGHNSLRPEPRSPQPPNPYFRHISLLTARRQYDSMFINMVV